MSLGRALLQSKSMGAAARSFSKSIDIYDQDIHFQTLCTLWHPSSLNFIHNLSHMNGSSNIVAVTEVCQIIARDFSSIDSNYKVQGVDYEVFCGQWRERSKVFSFRVDSNWLGFNKCFNRDVLGGWSDSGCIFVADIIAEEIQINT